MIFKLFPKENNFFDLLEKQVSFAIDAAVYFKELAATGNINLGTLGKMQGIEHQGDESAHRIFDQLNKTFITPFDREDIHALAKEIDDIVDMITTIVNRMQVYKLSGPNKNLAEFSIVIHQSVEQVACAVKGLRSVKNYDSIMKSCVEINSLENVGDAMRDKLLAELFEKEKDTITIIKWKEIYEDAETVLDICEDVAHIVQSILVKQA